MKFAFYLMELDRFILYCEYFLESIRNVKVWIEVTIMQNLKRKAYDL